MWMFDFMSNNKYISLSFSPNHTFIKKDLPTKITLEWLSSL